MYVSSEEFSQPGRNIVVYIEFWRIKKMSTFMVLFVFDLLDDISEYVTGLDTVYIGRHAAYWTNWIVTDASMNPLSDTRITKFMATCREEGSVFVGVETD